MVNAMVLLCDYRSYSGFPIRFLFGRFQGENFHPIVGETGAGVPEVVGVKRDI